MPVAPEEEPEIQLRRACADLHRRLQAGESARAEEFLATFPALSSDADLAVELIYTEYVAREARGQAPPQEECLARFPQWREPLARLFQVHQLLDESGNGDRSPTLDKSALASLGADGKVIGHYEVIEELGRGGMGVVYKARDIGLDRVVALKMILAGAHAGPAELSRFRMEAEAAARLHHPHIVQIYEVGQADGHPYLAMEFVEGASLSQWLSGKPQPGQEAAALIETLARAMDYAHQQGIIHRDLKPGNVLLSSQGVPKITDFGLAKRIGQPAGQTQSGAILGTVSYMAPEQAGGNLHRVGPWSDVYALGAILYEMLTGRPPFGVEVSLETLARVVNDDPPSLAQLQPNIPRDLETICLKCLQKEPQKRYTDAAALADDLRRFLAGEPIQARPTGAVERGVKWARRRPALAALLTFSFLALLCMLVGSLWYSAQLRQAIHRAERLQQDTDRQAGELRKQFEQSRRSLYALQLSQVEVVWERDPGRGLELLEDHQRCPPDLRDFTWGFFHRLCQRDRLTLPEQELPVLCVAFSPDGRYLATASGDEPRPNQPGQVHIHDLVSGKVHSTLAGFQHLVSYVAFSADGKRLATVSGDRLGKAPAEVTLWDSATAMPIASLRGHASWVTTVAFCPKGALLATAGADKTVRLWDAVTGKGLDTLKGYKDTVMGVAFSPDGKTLLTTSSDSMKLWDVETRREKFTLNVDGRVGKTAYAPDSVTLACIDGNRVSLWDAASYTLLYRLKGHTNRITSLAYSPDSKVLVTGSEDFTVKLWDVAEGREITTLKGQGRPVTSVAFAPDGQSFASASADKTVKLWKVAPSQPGARLHGHEAKVLSLAFSSDGRTLATGSVDHNVKLWDTATGQEIATLRGHKGAIRAMTSAPDDRTLVTASEDKSVKVWDLAAHAERLTLTGHSLMVTSVAISPDGRWLASGSHDKTVKIWDLSTGDLRTTLLGHTHLIRVLAFSPDGKLLASGSEDQSVRLWNTASWQEQAVLNGHTRGLNCLAFSPDGHTLATGGSDLAVKLWDLQEFAERLTLKGHTHYVQSVAFSPDGKTLATGSGDRWLNVPGEVKLWDPVTGQVRATLQGHAGPVAFSHDSKTLATSGADGSVSLWISSAEP